jgi:hypothetical protein
MRTTLVQITAAKAHRNEIENCSGHLAGANSVVPNWGFEKTTGRAGARQAKTTSDQGAR